MGHHRPSLRAAAALAAVTLLASAALVSAQGGDRGDPFAAADVRLYSPRSPFNQAIERDPSFDRDSDAMIAGLVEEVDEGGATVTWRRFTVPLVVAGPNTPRRRVRLTAPWRARRAILSVPLPRNAMPDPASDGHLAVIDPATRCEYDFWKLRRRGEGWSASWANAISVDSSGVYPRGLSARGSGFALLAGVVMPGELERGRIDHALLLSYPRTRSRGPVSPATESDGRTPGRDAIPEGARLQLDPSLDLATLGLTRYERTIARALQVYGAYVGDTGGRGVSFYALHPNGAPQNPYRSTLPNDSYPPLAGIPFDRMKVLRLGPQRRRSVRVVRNGCVRYAR